MAGMATEELTKEKLWQILVETVHACVMYPTRKSYTRDFILKQKPDVTAGELALRLNMPLGEALVILGELRPDNKSAT
jgi:hypothetical protein